MPPSPAHPSSAPSPAPAPGAGGAATRPGAVGFDDLAARVERVRVEQRRLGGVTAQAKEAVDRALDAAQRRPGPPAPPIS